MKLNKKEKEELKKIMRAYLDKIYKISCRDIDLNQVADSPPYQVDIVNRFLDMQLAKHQHKKKK